MRFDELSEMVDRDLRIDDTELDVESIKTPQLHNKYLKIYTQLSLSLKKTKDDRKVLYKEKWEYYTGKSSPEIYKENPFDLKILRSDVQMYIDADKEYQEATQKEEYIKMMADYSERILREINNRGFIINNTIKWKQFLHGE
jgi:hypothetical protein